MKLLKVFAIVALWGTMGYADSRCEWRTTHQGFSNGTCQVEQGKIRATMNPLHVDIEEEVVIGTRGSVWWGDSLTLEIFGEFTLPAGASLRSMLLWNGNTILKAKLKMRADADRSYENVVQRQADRPIVRDPAIIEYVGNNRYQFKIYPVKINNSRKIRILYSVPLQFANENPDFSITPAFITGGSIVPNVLSLEVFKSNITGQSCLIQYGSIRKQIEFGGIYQIPIPQNYWERPNFVVKLIPNSLTIANSYTSYIGEGEKAGWYSVIYASIPSQIQETLNNLENIENYSLEVKMNVGEKVYLKDVERTKWFGVYVKSPLPWDSTLNWTVYNSQGVFVAKYKQRISPIINEYTNKYVPLLWASHYTFVEQKGDLGALFGFIDSKMSLLALEQDTLPKSQQEMYRNSGVPTLTANEIIFTKSAISSLPDDNVMFIMTSAKDRLDAYIQNSLQISFNRQLSVIEIKLKGNLGQLGRVKVYDIKGRELENVEIVKAGNSVFHLKGKMKLKGMYIVKLYIGDKEISQMIRIP